MVSEAPNPIPHIYMANTNPMSHPLNPPTLCKTCLPLTRTSFLHLVKLKFILDKGGLLQSPQEFSHNSALLCNLPPTVDYKPFPLGTVNDFLYFMYLGLLNNRSTYSNVNTYKSYKYMLSKWSLQRPFIINC